MKQEKWGIIYNYKAGIRRYTRKRWNAIREYLVERRVPFEYAVASEYGSAEELAVRFVKRGFRTIVIVGGDGAVNDVVNGIMKSDIKDKTQIHLGIIPNGIGNDFAAYWGINSNYKSAVETIINGRTRKIDVGHVSYFKDGERPRRYFINALNIGVGARITKITDRTRRFFGVKWLSYISALFLILFVKKLHRTHILINGEHIRGRMMNICIGSARGYGQTPSAVPYNGWLDVTVIYHPRGMQLLKGLWLFIRGRLLNHKEVKCFRTKEVKILRAKNAITDTDGRLFKHEVPLTVNIEHEVLSMIIPQ